MITLIFFFSLAKSKQNPFINVFDVALRPYTISVQFLIGIETLKQAAKIQFSFWL